MDNLYSAYHGCLSVWLHDVYRDLHKNKTFGSLKLLLKLRNIKFLKHFSYVILNSRGDLDDPLIEFLLYLVSLVVPPTEESSTVKVPSSPTLDSPASPLSRSQSVRNTPRSHGRKSNYNRENDDTSTHKNTPTPSLQWDSNPDIRWDKTIRKRYNMGSLSIDSVVYNMASSTSPRTPNGPLVSQSTISFTRSPSRLPSLVANSGFRFGYSLRDSTRKLTRRASNRGIYTSGNRTSNRSRSPLPDSHLIPGYVVFINMFLSALIPILLYTYLQRVKGRRNNHLSVVHDYYKFISGNSSKDPGLQTKISDDRHLVFSRLNNFFMGSTTISSKKKDKKVFRSLRTPGERLLLKVGSFSNLLGLIGSGNLLHELDQYKSLFSHFCKPVTTSAVDQLDNTSGLQVLLYKLSLLNLNYHNHNYTEVPNTIYNIYNKLDDTVLKAQLESSLIYCYRLRINDLNLKVNVSKLFKNLIKFSKYSENKLKHYHNPLITAPSTNHTRASTGSSHLAGPIFKAKGTKPPPFSPNLMYDESGFREFSDRGILNLVMNNLVFFGNNLLYLNRVLSTSPISTTRSSGTNRAERDGFGSFQINSYVNDEDRYMNYVYRIVRLIRGDTEVSRRGLKAGNFRDTLSGGLRINNMEYVYNILLHLFRYVFQLNNTSEDVLSYHPRHLLGVIGTRKTNNNPDMNGSDSEGGDSGTANKITIENKYSVFDCRSGGNRIFVNDRLCLLVFKLNFDFYRLVFSNSSMMKDVHQAILDGNLNKVGGDEDWSNSTHYSSRDLTYKTKEFAENNQELLKSYLYSVYTYLNVIDTVRDVKKRISYEMYPVSYWLVCSHLNLLESRLDSQCQSKPP